MKKILFLLLFVSSFCFAHAVPQQEEERMEVSSNIKKELQSLKQEFQDMNDSLLVLETQLKNTKNQLAISEEDRLQSQTLLNELNFCLKNTNESLIQSSLRIENLETKLKIKTKICTSLIIALAAFMILKVLVMVLKYRFNISLPYWLNCLV